jgi:pyridoxine 4-dehydrogenase
MFVSWMSSPLGRGFLTGRFKSSADLQGTWSLSLATWKLIIFLNIEGDFRTQYSRFKEENMKHNLAMVDALEVIAKRKGISVAQLCIAWVAALGPHVIPTPGSSCVLHPFIFNEMFR